MNAYKDYCMACMGNVHALFETTCFHRICEVCWFCSNRGICFLCDMDKVIKDLQTAPRFITNDNGGLVIKTSQINNICIVRVIGIESLYGFFMYKMVDHRNYDIITQMRDLLHNRIDIE